MDSGITFEVIPTFEIVGGPEMLQPPEGLDWRVLLGQHIKASLSIPHKQVPPQFGSSIHEILVSPDPMPDHALHALLHDLLEDDI